MPAKKTHPQLSVSKTLLLLFSLSLSIFMIALFVRASLPRHESFVGPMTGLPMFERLLPAGTLISEDSISLLPDTERPAYAVGYSLGSQSGVALVVWDPALRRYGAVSNRLFATGISGSAARPPKLTVESLGSRQPWIIMVKTPIGERSEGIFFALRQGNDLKFVDLTDSRGTVRSAFFVTGQLSAGDENGAAVFDLQDINGDGLAEARVYTRSISAGDAGSGPSVSVEVYLWRAGGFVYDSELSRILTSTSGMFPEPFQP